MAFLSCGHVPWLRNDFSFFSFCSKSCCLRKWRISRQHSPPKCALLMNYECDDLSWWFRLPPPYHFPHTNLFEILILPSKRKFHNWTKIINQSWVKIRQPWGGGGVRGGNEGKSACNTIWTRKIAFQFRATTFASTSVQPDGARLYSHIIRFTISISGGLKRIDGLVCFHLDRLWGWFLNAYTRRLTLIWFQILSN